ncbi:MAG: hypothetical protein WCS01_06890 [bacterium]
MSDDSKTNDGTPPRFSLKPPVGTSSEAKKQTTRVDVPPSQDSPTTLKKKTSRISLDQTAAEAGAPPGLPVPTLGITAKAIRMAPAAPTPPSLSIPKLPSTPVPSALSGGEGSDETKRQTSRISLESILGERNTGAIEVTAATNEPKTIRIKRPTLPQSLKPAASVPAPKATASAPIEASPKSTTARLTLGEEAPAEGQATQRKTIKIKRAEGGASVSSPAPRSPAVARFEAETAARMAEEGAQTSFHAFFPVAAAVALIILGVVVYILLAQAFPNPSLNYPGRIII